MLNKIKEAMEKAEQVEKNPIVYIIGRAIGVVFLCVGIWAFTNVLVVSDGGVFLLLKRSPSFSGQYVIKIERSRGGRSMFGAMAEVAAARRLGNVLERNFSYIVAGVGDNGPIFFRKIGR